MVKKASTVVIMAILLVMSSLALVVTDTENDNSNVSYTSISYSTGDWIKIGTPEELSMVGSGETGYPADGKYVLDDDIDFTDVDLNGGFDIDIKLSSTHRIMTLSIERGGLPVHGTGMVSVNGTVMNFNGEDFTYQLLNVLDVPYKISGGGVTTANAGDRNFAFAVTMHPPSIESSVSETVNSNGNMYPLSQNGLFTGELHGNGYSIIGLNTAVFNSSAQAYAGLFASVNGTTGDGLSGLRSIGGSTVAVTTGSSSASYAGGLVGAPLGAVTVNKCYVETTVSSISKSGISYAGGLVGASVGAVTVTDSYSKGDVRSASLTDSTANSYAGGLVGDSTQPLTVTGSHSEGATSSISEYGISYAGGLVANVTGAVTITNSYNDGAVSSTSGSKNSNASGLVTTVTGAVTITDSYSEGAVSSKTGSARAYAGGLATTVTGRLTITDCYVKGTVFSTGIESSYANGIADFATNVEITNVYVNSEIDSHNTTGAKAALRAVGTGASYITNVYFIQTDVINVGLLLYNSSNPVIIDGLSSSTPRRVLPSGGLAPAKLQDRDSYFGDPTTVGALTFLGWSFNTKWVIDMTPGIEPGSRFNGGFPALRSTIITQQPEDVSSGDADGNIFYIITNKTPLGYQWQKQTTTGAWYDIYGATSDIYITTKTMDLIGDVFRCEITVGTERIVSEEAHLNGTCIDLVMSVGGKLSYNGKDISASGSIPDINVSSIEFTIVPAPGYKIDSVLLDEVDITATIINWKFTVDTMRDRELEVTFITAQQFEITASVSHDSRGSITPKGSVSVTETHDESFFITSNVGYIISYITVDGNDILPDSPRKSTYEFKDIKGSHSITAVFEVEMFVVDASVDGGHGTVDPEGETEVEWDGSIRFTMTPDEGYAISSITVNGIPVSNPTAPYLLENVRADTIIIFTFGQIVLDVTATAGTGGSVTPPLQQINWGAEATITISTDKRYVISSITVNGDPCPIANPFIITDVKIDMDVYVTFSLGFTIEATAGEGGTITPEGIVPVLSGEGKTFTVTVNDGYMISTVLVDNVAVDLTPEGTYTFPNVADDHTIDVTFVRTSFIISVTAGEGGTIDPSEDVTVPHGGTQTFTVTPGEGYDISKILVDGLPVTQNPYTFPNVTDDHSIEVTFAIKTFTVEASAPEGHGTVTPDRDTVEWGGDVTFTITADDGYSISEITVNGMPVTDIENPFILEGVKDNVTVVVTLSEGFMINATAGEGGSITPSGLVSVDPGKSQKFTATADDGYELYGMLVDGSPVIVSEYTFTNVTKNHTIDAIFIKTSFLITVSANEGGTIDPSEDVTVPRGGTQTFTVTPREGYDIYEILVDGSPVTQNPYTFPNVTDDHSIEVTFAIKTFTVVASVEGGHGIIDPAGGTTVDWGGDVTFTITPEDGYVISSITVNGVSVIISNPFVIKNVKDDATVVVTFKTGFSINATAGTGGFITPSGLVPVDPGNSQKFTAVPDDGYIIFGILVDGSPVSGDEFTFNNVTGNHTIEAMFIKSSFIIRVTVGEGGTMEPSEDVTVPRAGSQKFTATADDGYTVSVITVDGSSVPGDEYTFTDVDADHVIEVTFKLVEYNVGSRTAGAEGGSVSLSDNKATIDDTITVTVNLFDGFDVEVTASHGVVSDIGDNKYTVTGIDGNCTITATFTAHDSPGGGDNTMIIVAVVAVVAIGGLGAAYVFMIKPKK